jgi:hypothetical protein
MAEVIERSRGNLPDWVVESLPADADSYLKDELAARALI